MGTPRSTSGLPPASDLPGSRFERLSLTPCRRAVGSDIRDDWPAFGPFRIFAASCTALFFILLLNGEHVGGGTCYR